MADKPPTTKDKQRNQMVATDLAGDSGQHTGAGQNLKRSLRGNGSEQIHVLYYQMFPWAFPGIDNVL